MEPQQSTEAQLKGMKNEQLKDILKANGLISSGVKVKLIQRILEFQKTGKGKKSRNIVTPKLTRVSSIPRNELPVEIEPPKEINREGKYLQGAGKYQKEYNKLQYLLNETGLDGSEEGNFLDAAIYIYDKYFENNTDFIQAYSEIKIKGYPIAEEYDNILYKYRNIETPEEYDIFMDKVIYLISKRLKDKETQKNTIATELLGYEDPRYYDIGINKNLLDYLISEVANRISPKELQSSLTRNRIGWFNFKPGDIVGFRLENSSPNSLPDIILYFNINRNNGIIYYESVINYKGEQNRFKNTGQFELPGDLKYGSPELLENIYHFPFNNI